MKKTIALILLSASVLMTASCTHNDEGNDTSVSSETVAPQYVVDTTPTELTAAVNAVLPISADMAAPDPGITLAYYEDVAEDIASFSVLMNASGATQDEYGIFQAKTVESVPAIEAAVRVYLDDKLAAFTGMYTPEEKPKLENASIKVFGNYIVYCTLSEEDTATVFNTVEDLLLKKDLTTASQETVAVPEK